MSSDTFDPYEDGDTAPGVLAIGKGPFGSSPAASPDIYCAAPRRQEVLQALTYLRECLLVQGPESGCLIVVRTYPRGIARRSHASELHNSTRLRLAQ